MTMTVEELIKTYRAAGDAAYGDYIAILSRDSCNGVEHKMKTGTFTEANLKAHTTAAESLGKHRACVAFVQALQSISQSDALRWPIQPEGIGLILTEALNIPEIAEKIAKAIQSGNY